MGRSLVCVTAGKGVGVLLFRTSARCVTSCWRASLRFWIRLCCFALSLLTGASGAGSLVADMVTERFQFRREMVRRNGCSNAQKLKALGSLRKKKDFRKRVCCAL
jgi:hypothetical protein